MGTQHKTADGGFFSNENLGRIYVTACAGVIIALTIAVISFVTIKGTVAFRGSEPLSLTQFLFSSEWRPDASAEQGGPAFGALIFILGSVLVSTLAVALGGPLAIASAIFIAEISPQLGERYLRPILELFAGIPSVVYGWVGLSVLVPMIRNYLGGMGFSVMAGAVVLAIMILPTVTTLSVDALRTLPASYREGALALGSTRWQTIYHVILPAAWARIGMAVTLGLARAFGEALAVQMVLGNSIQLPGSLLESTSTLTSIITMDMSNTVAGSPWNNVLWTMALLLLLITMGLILIIRRMGAGERQGTR